MALVQSGCNPTPGAGRAWGRGSRQASGATGGDCRRGEARVIMDREGGRSRAGRAPGAIRAPSRISRAGRAGAEQKGRGGGEGGAGAQRRSGYIIPRWRGQEVYRLGGAQTKARSRRHRQQQRGFVRCASRARLCPARLRGEWSCCCCFAAPETPGAGSLPPRLGSSGLVWSLHRLGPRTKTKTRSSNPPRPSPCRTDPSRLQPRQKRLRGGAGGRTEKKPLRFSLERTYSTRPTTGDYQRVPPGSVVVGAPLPKMSLLAGECHEVSAPQKKQLDLGDVSDTNFPEPKRPRLGPLPGLAPCLQPLTHPPPTAAQDSRVSQLGPYLLLEATEGGCCYRAVHRHTEAEYTCKVYPAKSYPEVMAPYGVLPLHPSVARVTEVILGNQNVYIFFQPSRGDMHNYMRQRRRLPEPEAAAFFRQMAEAVAHCHQHGIVLRDLKLRKFVFANQERSKLLLENLEDSCVLSGPDDSLEDKHGCPAYVGPEILSSKSSYSGKAADVWSLGVVLYTLLVGCYPFQDTKPASLFGKIRRGRFAVPEDLSPRARCLIRCLLRKDPAERLTASGILLHPWLAAGSISEGPWRSPFGEQGLEQVVPEVGNLREAEDEQREEEGLYS